jgi:hypothetical protein
MEMSTVFTSHCSVGRPIAASSLSETTVDSGSRATGLWAPARHLRGRCDASREGIAGGGPSASGFQSNVKGGRLVLQDLAELAQPGRKRLHQRRCHQVLRGSLVEAPRGASLPRPARTRPAPVKRAVRGWRRGPAVPRLKRAPSVLRPRRERPAPN